MPKKTKGVPRQYGTAKKQLARRLASRIRSSRKALDLTQTALRERLQLEGVFVTKSQFSRIELGEKLPDASEILAICKALKVTPDWLLLGEEGHADALGRLGKTSPV